MKIVALLPMKANSERVKGKNFRKFGDKPLFQWVLNTLLSVDKIDLVVINTDAKEILIKNGLIENKRILLRNRDPKICGDFVSMNTIIANDLENIDADIFLMTHTTNPFLSKRSIESALTVFIKALDDNKADSLFSVNKIQERFYNEKAEPLNHDPMNLIRTQDLDPWYKENSNLYLFTKDAFQKTQARIGEHPIIFETPLFESTDIDTPDDWDLGEVMISYYQEKGVLK